MEYTKGKWFYESGCIENGSHVICVMNKIGDKIDIDARLIATAPALYEALKAWGKLRAMHPLDSGADIDEIFWECCEITDKALAKAEGK